MKISTPLELLNNNTSFSYIGDRKTGLYHCSKCPLIPNLSLKDVQGCGKNPEKSGFVPCSICLSSRADKVNNKYDMKFKEQQITLREMKCRSKADIMKEQIIILSSDLGMHIEFYGSTAYITTIAGEWFFDYCIRPIRLHHKSLPFSSNNFQAPKTPFHQQDITFSTPAQTLAYIYRHENATVKRLINEDSLIE